MRKLKTFEEFLIDQHALDYIGTDDEMADNYEKWVSELDNQELIDYAEEWGGEIKTDIACDVQNLLNNIEN